MLTLYIMTNIKRPEHIKCICNKSYINLTLETKIFLGILLIYILTLKRTCALGYMERLILIKAIYRQN